MMENYPAKPEYATAKIAVWWDMKDCPIPEGYDARRVRSSMEAAFKKLGYSGPVSITAYGDQKQIPDHILRGLSSTGVAVTHTVSVCTSKLMFSDMLEWRGHNPPPATMMLISNQVESVFSWELVRLQQHTKYNLFLAYSVTSEFVSVLLTSAAWLWKTLLESADNKLLFQGKCSETELSALFSCKSCSLDGQSLENFRKHRSSIKHALKELTYSRYTELDSVTREWGRNYPAKPEDATAKISVWWDMKDCPIPNGYDARRVRPSIEAAFKKLGYSGPVSITAYGDQKQTPDHLLRGLSSTGVAVAHSIPEVIYKRMFSDMLKWRNHNPPPATMMLISDHLVVLENSLTRGQQRTKYNLFLAYSFRPCKMSVLVTSAEWLWESLLAVSETRRHVLQKCSERGEDSTGMFYCKLCFCDFKSLDDFRKNLSSKEHALEEGNILELLRYNNYQRKRRIEVEDFPKSKRLRKAFPTGFRLLHNHLRLTNGRGARKSQTCKKEN